MMTTLAGFPFWKLRFNGDGALENPQEVTTFFREVRDKNLTDLFFFAHGWNNTDAKALTRYLGFFEEMRKLLEDPSVSKRREATIGTVGIFWPSILWPDEEPDDAEGGPASLDFGDSGGDLFVELKKVFITPQQQQTLDELSQLLEQRPTNEGALQEFKAKLSELVKGQDVSPSSLDNVEQDGLLAEDDLWLQLLDDLADHEPEEDSQGGVAAGPGDPFQRLWRGAKGALRSASYWQMKARAGVVGKAGLGPFLGRLHDTASDLRVHLLGHSFGARLISYSLAGLPATLTGSRSPIKSLFLLQGAFSHFAFADTLPFDRSRKGDLAGMTRKVDGPLLVTHSEKDLAVTIQYPAASIIHREDAATLSEILYRWGAMGHDGAQAVNARPAELGEAGTIYEFEIGKWLNLDGNQVIVRGSPPSGAHSDIVHPHTAWAALAAAGIGGNA